MVAEIPAQQAPHGDAPAVRVKRAKDSTETRRLSEIERHLDNSQASDQAAIGLCGYRLQPSVPAVVPATVRREWMLKRRIASPHVVFL